MVLQALHLRCRINQMNTLQSDGIGWNRPVNNAIHNAIQFTSLQFYTFTGRNTVASNKGSTLTFLPVTISIGGSTGFAVASTRETRCARFTISRLGIMTLRLGVSLNSTHSSIFILVLIPFI